MGLRTVRILALLCAGLAAMCVALAVAWSREHQRAECWATAAELDLAPDRACGDPGYARAARGR